LGFFRDLELGLWDLIPFASAGITPQNISAMRVLALDHGSKRIGVAISDPTGVIAQPVESMAPEPFANFLERLKQILREKEVELILIGMPRNMDGSYGPAALKVQEFVNVLKQAVTVPITTWDERLTSVQANRFLIQADVRRADRKQRVDKTAAAILLQSYLDSRSIAPNPDSTPE
jgi:putative holliday junction resolvase